MSINVTISELKSGKTQQSMVYIIAGMFVEMFDIVLLFCQEEGNESVSFFY